MTKLLLLNAFLMMLWPALTGKFTVMELAVGFVLGAIIISVPERAYGRRILKTFSLVLYVLWEILVSNISLATLVLAPGKIKRELNPHIVGIPLQVETSLEITLLASVITLTPGTLSMELGKDENGKPTTLYVHNLQVQEPDEFIARIHNGFERRIMDITRGEAA